LSDYPKNCINCRTGSKHHRLPAKVFIKGWGSVGKNLAADFDAGKSPQSLHSLVSTEVKNGAHPFFNNISL